jgi:LysM repeat protein
MVSGEREPPRLDRVRTSWAPRVLAPLAFFTFVTLLVLVVHSALNADAGGSTTPTQTQAGPTTGETGQTGTMPRQRRRFYRIQEGDTLDVLAERFNTTVDDLLQLNPGINPNGLTPGQRIRIR